MISGRVTPENPFTVDILPLAYSNERVLYGILAVSGAHALCSLEQSEYDWRSLYAVTLRSIKHDLVSWHVMDLEQKVGLSTATLLLTLCEVSF